MSDNNSAYLQAPSKERVLLSETVPLESPLCIRIEPTRICNFRCEFCRMSVDEYRKRADHQILDFELFLSIIEDIKQSFGHVKNMMLVGTGEPLLHPKFADMVAAITYNHVADTVETTTNASVLTPELSDRLVSAGLSLMRISVNGLSEDDFLKHCGVKISFDDYVKNIAYLFSHRGKMKIYTKIINYMVKDKRSYDRFIAVFGPISDIINVENLVEDSPAIDYKKIAGDDIQFNRTQSNTELLHSKICSMPFYTIDIRADGSVCPCCTPEAPCIGNIKDLSLGDIWKKSAFAFQRKMLEGVNGDPICSVCSSMKFRGRPEDVLDLHVKEIKDRYDRKLIRQ